MVGEFKRHIAYKFRIGDIIKGSPFFDQDKLKHVSVHSKNASRVNIIANVTEKYIQDDEKKFASITLDDASGQIKLKAFGDDIEKLKDLEQGQTIMTIGLLRYWNNEIYMTPEIVKQKTPEYLLIRKMEAELLVSKPLNPKEATEIKDKIIQIVKREEANNGADIDSIIQELKSQKEIINSEIKKLLEEGVIYEPRPGKVRYLG